MPIIRSEYRPPAWMRDRHTQTLVPALFRRARGPHYERERISTYDRDFLDIDWAKIGSSKLVILAHGMEGNTSQEYMVGMVRILNEAGWDAMGWNFRSCSGELNNKVRFYRADTTEDIDCVVRHALKTGKYKEIALLGFSLGGCQTLKYLGNLGSKAPSELSRGIAISVPCNLNACVKSLSYGFNKIVYLRRFVTVLKAKLTEKIRQYPDLLSHLDVNLIQGFEDFDNFFTAPLYGYRDAKEYYENCSCKPDIPEIRVPTLILNAQNDPFIPRDAQPIKECQENPWVTLEMPTDGGHVGFMLSSINGPYWTEKRTLEFLK